MSATSNQQRIPRTILAIALVALTIAACQAAASPAPTPAPTAAPTAMPTPTVVDGGSITLSDTGCSWAGNPESIAAGRFPLKAKNDTDDYGLFIIHRLLPGKTWADGEALIAAIQEALKTGADWPPAVSDAIGEMAAEAGGTTSMVVTATPGTYGVVCSANTSASGDILTVFLVGPLTVDP